MNLRSIAVTLVCAVGGPTACGADAKPAPAPSVEPAPARSAFVLPDTFANRFEAYVDSWGHYWPTFRLHGETAVFVDGEERFAQAHGVRDLAAAQPHETGDAYEIGTLSVHIALATTLALVEQGKLSWTDSAATWVPDAGIPADITIEHLVTFTSGLPSFVETFQFRFMQTRPQSNEALVTMVGGGPLEFAPGEDFAPSLSNTTLLGLVLERAGEAPYPQLVRREVLEPLDMNDTHYGRQAEASIGLSFHEDEYLVSSTQIDPQGMAAAGAWTSTTHDLSRLYHALMDGRWGIQNLRGTFGDNDAGVPFGFVATTSQGLDAFTWIGRIAGHEHAVVLVPSKKLAVVHLSNSEVVPGDTVADAAATLALGGTVSLRDEAREVPIDTSRLTSLAARWKLRGRDAELVYETVDQDTAASLLEVTTAFEDGTLRLTIPGRAAKPMHPSGADAFFFKDRPQSTARIVRRHDGIELVLERGGGALHYRPIPLADEPAPS